MSNEWWGWSGSQLWQVTLLIPVSILLVRWLGRGRSHLAYGLLVVVLLKCVTPPVWSSRLSPFSWAERTVAASATGSEESSAVHSVDSAIPGTATVHDGDTGFSGDRAEVTQADVPTTDSLPSVEARPAVAAEIRDPAAATTDSTVPSVLMSIDWMWLAVLAFSTIWLLGMCCVASALLIGTWRLRQWRRTAEPADERIREQARRLARQMGLPSTPEVLVTDEAVMPAAVGLWREVVLLPRHLIDSVSTEEFELVLAHELNHFRRWDTVIGGLQAVAQVVWWFHPLVWWLNRELRRYREQCCDEEILARLECRPPVYARCLLNVLELNERFSPALGLAGMSPFEMTSQRLRNIMRSRAGFTAGMPRWCWFVLVVSALVVLPGAGLTLDANALPHVEGVSPPSEQDEGLAGSPAADGTRTEVAGDGAADTGAVLAELRYRWRQGEHLAYRTNIEVDLGDEIETYSGTMSLSVRNADERGAELVLGGIGLTSWRRPKPGRLPRLGGFSFPEIPTPSYGLPVEESVRADTLGHILAERGELERLPALLGSWPAYVLQPLSESVESSWTAQSTETVLFEAGPFREETIESRLGSPYRQPTTESLRARLNADFEVTSADVSALTIVKHYSLTTIEQVDGLPRAEMSGDKTVTWDVERGLPLSITEDSRFILREGNVATTYPVTVRCELLQPAADSQGTDGTTMSDATAISIPVTYDGPAPVPSSGLPVTEETVVDVGDVVQVEWSGAWFPADVLAVEDDGRLQIHFRGFSDRWDASVHRSRVQLPGPEYVE